MLNRLIAPKHISAVNGRDIKDNFYLLRMIREKSTTRMFNKYNYCFLNAGLKSNLIRVLYPTHSCSGQEWSFHVV